jgi:hypothetical protein
LGLNWGPLSVKDPVIQFELKTSWNHFAYNELTENAIYSDFDPRFAKEAEVRVKWNSVYGLQDFPLTVAVDVLLNMLNYGSSVESIEDVLFSLNYKKKELVQQKKEQEMDLHSKQIRNV